jgi:hypothetical protein
MVVASSLKPVGIFSAWFNNEYQQFIQHHDIGILMCASPVPPRRGLAVVGASTP